MLCSSEVLASFHAQARVIRFYDVPLGDVKEELRFRCELEPFNARDEEASAHLVPLLLAGFHAEG